MDRQCRMILKNSKALKVISINKECTLLLILLSNDGMIRIAVVLLNSFLKILQIIHRTPCNQTQRVRRPQFGHNSNIIYFDTGNGLFHVWDLSKSGGWIQTQIMYSTNILEYALNDSETCLVICCFSTVKICTKNNGSFRIIQICSKMPNQPIQTCFGFGYDFYTCETDGIVNIWQEYRGKWYPYQIFEVGYKRHQNKIQMEFNRNTHQIIACEFNLIEIRDWNNRIMQKLNGSIPFGMSKNGDYFITKCYDYNILIYSINDNGHFEQISSIAQPFTVTSIEFRETFIILGNQEQGMAMYKLI